MLYLFIDIKFIMLLLYFLFFWKLNFWDLFFYFIKEGKICVEKDVFDEYNFF